MPTLHPPHIRQLAYETLHALREGRTLRVWAWDPEALLDVLEALQATPEELSRLGLGGRLFMRYVYQGDRF